jgi:hypothetical protein
MPQKIHPWNKKNRPAVGRISSLAELGSRPIPTEPLQLIVWRGDNKNATIGHFVVVIPRKGEQRVWWLDPPNRGKWVKVSDLKCEPAPIIVLQPR